MSLCLCVVCSVAVFLAQLTLGAELEQIPAARIRNLAEILLQQQLIGHGFGMKCSAKHHIWV